jgi:hypothetical protein
MRFSSLWPPALQALLPVAGSCRHTLHHPTAFHPGSTFVHTADVKGPDCNDGPASTRG